MKIAALAGGVGGAKLALGLSRVMDPGDLTIVVNTGDDIVLHGLHISPDPDIVIYTLAGVVNPETGWGFKDETFHALERLKALGAPSWFNLGDKDLATHILRTEMLRAGHTLTAALDMLRSALGVAAKIVPMSDDFAPTFLETAEGHLHLQEYLVKRRAEPKLRAVDLGAAKKAKPASAALSAIKHADGIIICPSNPLISIGPILAVTGIREALRARRGNTIAVSPLIGGKSLKGPSDRMMRELNLDASAPGIAAMYRDIAAQIVIDAEDEAASPAIAALGVRAIVTDTHMRSLGDRERLARETLTGLGR
jgi:LPPG:FO 2-phospho-L-lactate transferase